MFYCKPKNFLPGLKSIMGKTIQSFYFLLFFSTTICFFSPISFAQGEKAGSDPGHSDKSYVSGRLLMLVSTEREGESGAILAEVTRKYHLKIGGRKKLSQFGREIVLFSARGDMEALSRRIRREHKGLQVQPDYYYFTLGEIEEDLNREAVLGFLNLETNATGRGIRVAIIDTGVDINHEDLSSRIVTYTNFVEDSGYRAEIHGTAVAGVIGASLNGNGTAGIAPESKLIALRACEQLYEDRAVARCSSSSIVQAIDKAIVERADVVNMSLGTSFSDHIVATILDDPAAANTLFLAPAGNDAGLTTLSFPASHPHVISVAGELDDGSLVPNGRVASLADLILPSHYVLATLPGNEIGFMTGTSMASAEASGLFAILHPDLKTVAACRGKTSLVHCLAGLE